VQLRLLPLTTRQIEEMLRSLRGAKLFDGFRGRRKVDLGAVAATISGVAATFLEHDWLQEIEINPLTEGVQGIRVLDAVIRAHQASR
jgi:hypothetical protein